MLRFDFEPPVSPHLEAKSLKMAFASACVELYVNIKGKVKFVWERDLKSRLFAMPPPTGVSLIG